MGTTSASAATVAVTTVDLGRIPFVLVRFSRSVGWAMAGRTRPRLLLPLPTNDLVVEIRGLIPTFCVQSEALRWSFDAVAVVAVVAEENGATELRRCPTDGADGGGCGSGAATTALGSVERIVDRSTSAPRFASLVILRTGGIWRVVRR